MFLALSPMLGTSLNQILAHTRTSVPPTPPFPPLSATRCSAFLSTCAVADHFDTSSPSHLPALFQQFTFLLLRCAWCRPSDSRLSLTWVSLSVQQALNNEDFRSRAPRATRLGTIERGETGKDTKPPGGGQEKRGSRTGNWDRFGTTVQEHLFSSRPTPHTHAHTAHHGRLRQWVLRWRERRVLVEQEQFRVDEAVGESTMDAAHEDAAVGRDDTGEAKGAHISGKIRPMDGQ